MLARMALKDLGPRDWLRLWFIPALGALLVFSAALDLGPSIKAARGEGVHGTFTAKDEACGDAGPCTWHGQFVSDDGRVRLTDVAIDGGAHGVGSTVEALYGGRGSIPTVYQAHGSREWTAVVIVLVIGLLMLAPYTVLVLMSLHQRRRQSGPPS
jgi:hypothetical protein